MKKSMLIIFSVAAAIFFAGCGSSASITAAFSPVDAATNQALDVAITATFSGAVTAPSDWGAVFTVKETNGTTNLCTATVGADVGYAYDSTNNIVTCLHANLSSNTGYTASVSSLSGVTDNSAAFTSVPSATLTSKTEVTTTAAGSGSVTLRFTFSSAPSETPAVSVAEASASVNADISGKDLSGGNCTAASGDTTGTIFDCTVTGLAGCATFTDYTATVSVGGARAGTAGFNSADDEFTSGDTLTNSCWSPISNGGSIAISEGNMVLTTPGSAVPAVLCFKTKPGDYAISSYLYSTVDSTANDVAGAEFGLAEIGQGGDSLVFFSGYQLQASEGNIWMLGVPGGVNIRIAGDLSGYFTHIAPLRMCMVIYNGIVKSYINFDDISASSPAWTALTTDNMQCTDQDCTVSDYTEYAVSNLTGPALQWSIANLSNAEQVVKYGYARFKTTGIDGTSASCPPLP